MTLLKIYWRLKAVFKKLCFKIMFGKRFSIGKNTTFRKNFGLYLERVRQSKSVTIAFSIVAVLSTALKA